MSNFRQNSLLICQGHRNNAMDVWCASSVHVSDVDDWRMNRNVNPYSAGIDFSRQNLTSVDVRFWRLKSIHAL